MSLINNFFSFTKKSSNTNIDYNYSMSNFSIPTNNQLTYSGNLVEPEEDELRYFKESFDISDDINIEILQYPPKAYSVFKIDNIVIKTLLSDYDITTDTQKLTFESAKKICELTKKADLYNVGVKYFTNVIVNNKDNVTKRIYLFTEYAPQAIKKNFNKKLVEKLAKKICMSDLQYHSDFWYKNIRIDRYNILKAIDWGSYCDEENNEFYQVIKDKFCLVDVNDRVKLMMSRYNTDRSDDLNLN